MKKFFILLLTAFITGFISMLQAQDIDGPSGPTLITKNSTMTEVASLAEQMADGSFIPAEERIKEFNPKRWGANASVPGKGLPKGNDPLWERQQRAPQRQGRAPILSFDAASASATPTDPTGAVGPNHFMNSWNSSFRIWDKAGNPLTNAASLGTIFPGTLGDPIVLYDPFADRFLISEFFENGFDVAISKGPDPVTSGWYVYRFPTNTFPDYPKFSVWSDGYYITANKDQGSAGSSQVVFVLEREKMIAGNTSVQMLGFPLTGIITSGFYSPLAFNANGPTPPPAGNVPVVYMQDDSWSGVSTDHLKIWSVNVNWTTPASSTISAPQIINTAPFDGLFDGGSFSNLPQPSGSDIDALQATIMFMAQYRRFPGYNSAVFNFVVDLTNADNKAGIRWYELRQTTHGAPWSIYQEGTYSQPGGHSAFCGNMCMDINGNIGLAYTVVSSTQMPALRFTGRYASDPLGTMTIAEDVIVNGTSVDPSSRYGDYSQMTIDPVDNTTFWSIGEYFASGRKNRVGVFQIAPPALTAQFTGTPTSLCAGGSVTFTDNSLASPTSWQWSFPGGTPSSFSGQNPPPVVYSTPGTYDVTLTVSDGFSNDSEVKTGYITVKSVIADFTGTPVNVVVGNSVTFTDNSQCTPTSWSWSFPGGTPSTYNGQNPPPITYSTTGTYDVSLTVTNTQGSDTKTRSNYITVTPPIFNMANGTVTTCTGNFYDSGGSGGAYANNEVFVMTFYPSTPGAVLRFNFTSFSTELNYDTLTIYDGTSMAATRIGRYHGTTGPGIVTATNGAGALTFRFRSDISQTSTGWAATISCVTGLVMNPVTFTATPFSTSQINLAWTKNASNHDVMIVQSPNALFGTPADGTVYPSGSSIPGGGTVIYNGSLTSYQHTSLNPATTYYYKAYSYNSSVTYSTGMTASAATLCGTLNLPLSESFPVSTLPACWTKQNTGTGVTDKWTVSNTSNAGGSAYEMRSAYQQVSPGVTRLITPPISTAGIPSLNLSFRHMLDAWGTGCTLRVQSSSDGINWTNEAWSVATTSSNITATTVNTTIASNINSPNTWIAFTAEGNLYQYDYWYIDNVTVTSGCTSNLPVSVSVVAGDTILCAGENATFTATPVNGGTAPVYQWSVNGVNAGINSPSFSFLPSDGDIVRCRLTSSAFCVTGNPALSAQISLDVLPQVVPGISIAASANPVEAGVPVTFSATAVNGGSTPSFQWMVNGVPAGMNAVTFEYYPVDGDIVYCILTASGECVQNNPATSNQIVMEVISVALNNTIQNVTVSDLDCFDALQTISVAGNGTTFIVENGGVVTMIAGQNILYFPGTKVDSGGYLHGYIAPGGPWCVLPTMPATVTGNPLSDGYNGGNRWIVRPNPTSGHFTLEFSEKNLPQATAELFNMQGVRIGSPTAVLSRSVPFDLTGKPSGVYLIKVSSDNQSEIFKVLKQ